MEREQKQPMTDEQIEQALECCSIGRCVHCWYRKNGWLSDINPGCAQDLMLDALAYINRQNDFIAYLVDKLINRDDDLCSKCANCDSIEICANAELETPDIDYCAAGLKKFWEAHRR